MHYIIIPPNQTQPKLSETLVFSSEYCTGPELNTIRLTSYYASVVVVGTELIFFNGMFCSPPCNFYNNFDKYFYNQSYNQDCGSGSQSEAKLQKLLDTDCHRLPLTATDCHTSIYTGLNAQKWDWTGWDWMDL